MSAASGIASAQSTVTLYGLVDVYVGSTTTKQSQNVGASSSLRQTVIDSGGFNGSLFGLKGSEDLGSGLKANFVLEGGYDVSTGAANAYVSPYNFVAPTTANPNGLVHSNATFGRNAWVGVCSGLGEIKRSKTKPSIRSDTKRTGFGLAAKCDISKRTFLYTGLQLAKERDGIGEAKTDTFAAGVQHKF